MKILFSGAVFHPEWRGGEPVVGKELIQFLCKSHACRISKSFPFVVDRSRSILRFLEKDTSVFTELINKSEICSADVVLFFYDFDSTILRSCLSKKIPAVVTQHIYWGLCPKFDLWNNVYNCSCSEVEKRLVDCKKCISMQSGLGSKLVSTAFPKNLIDGIRSIRRARLSECAAIIVPSNHMAGLYKKELGNLDIRVIHNGLNTDFYKPINNESLSKKKRILYAGAQTYTKGYHHFVKLASEITKLRGDVEFVAFGNGNDSAPDCVRYLGYLDNSEIRRVYSESYLLVFPAFWDEPFGLVPLESMACGCPVIAYASGGLSETVVNGITGYLVPTGDFDSLLNATLELINNESKNKAMRTYAREHVVNNFSMKQMFDNYEKVLNEYAKHGNC